MSRPTRNANPSPIVNSSRTFFVSTKTCQGRTLLQSEHNATLMIDLLRSYAAARRFEESPYGFSYLAKQKAAGAKQAAEKLLREPPAALLKICKLLILRSSDRHFRPILAPKNRFSAACKARRSADVSRHD